ncbi:MAG: DUF423 domain-containing protein [Verrucomicrobiae bacterium]|nr:DUF423 domain-containing protein [Verrucomicrobiae bacterium]
MTKTIAIRVSAVLGLLAVGLGAFGAHGLKETLTQHGMVAVWEKAVFYHFIHTVILFVLPQRREFCSGPWLALFAGIILFSGSLYSLAITHWKWLGFITPFGGVCFVVGWIWLVISARKLVE